jgi:Cu-Zn family superoxide dismutase
MLGAGSTIGHADEVVVRMNLISAQGIGAAIGTIVVKDAHHGVTITPNLRSLPPGKHAFHIHQNPDCRPGMEDGKMVAGLKAGAHFDPTGEGHKSGHHRPHGDLPELTAAPDGTSTTPVISDTLSVAALRGRSIMIHRYGEAEAGKPKGGGQRLGCGVIPR